MKRLLPIIVTILAAFAAQAQSPRPVSEVWTLEFGTAHLADTYLTPLRYSGMHYGVEYARAQAMRFNPAKWTNSLAFAVRYDRTKNRAGNSLMRQALVEARWAMVRRWHLPKGVTAAVGGFADLTAGALLLMRNGNNPAQARASVTAGPEATLRWSAPKTWGAGATLRTPLIGAFFSPQYGELYYELALGDRFGLVHCAWPGSYRRLQAEIWGELRPRATALRLGYRADLLSFRANGITGRCLTHSITLGIATDLLSINPRRHEANTILAY